MFEFNTEKVKDKKEFTRVVLELEARGLTRSEAADILVSDYQYLFLEPTEEELNQIKERTILEAIAQMNRERIAKNGHPEIVSFRENGKMYHAAYAALSPEQITDFRTRGIIL